MISIAQFGLITLLSLFLALHFMILLKLVPYTLIWGGRIKSDKEMYRFEIFSVLINALLILIVLVQGRFLPITIPEKIMTCALWIMAGLFFLNTWGNLTSKNKLEQRLFAPLTILLALFSFVLALSN